MSRSYLRDRGDLFWRGPVTVGHDSRLMGRMESFEALIERESRNMYQLAYRLTGNDQDAQEIVQEGFFRAYRSRDTFEGRADVATWLHRIVANCALDFLRAVRSRPDRRWPQPIGQFADALASPVPNPERLAASAETAREIDRALDTLTPLERTAFVLRHFEGRSLDEIAHTFGIRSNAAKQHVFRAVRKLRLALDSHRSDR